MAFLLLVKLIIPFVLLAAVFGVLNRVIRSSDTALFLVAAVLAEFMTICFFFLVRDEGSWLDIGMSISHFAIMNAFLVFQLALVGISQYLLRHIEKPKLKKV
jgi:phosphatidylinositol glycan class N